MPETQITVVGNLTADPELKFISSGTAVTSFTVASTPRTLNRQTNEWEDGDTLFMRCSAWKDVAEGAAESLRRGDSVIVQGKLKQRSWETKEGEKRTVIELTADTVGKSVKARKQKASAGGDAWASAPAATSAFAGAETEPPF